MSRSKCTSKSSRPVGKPSRRLERKEKCHKAREQWNVNEDCPGQEKREVEDELFRLDALRDDDEQQVAEERLVEW